MTSEPTAAPGRTGADGGGQANDQPFIDDALASATLLLFSLTVAAGFARVFSGWDFFDDLAAVAVIGHVVAFATRRLRIPLILAFPLLIAVMAWLIGAMFYRTTYSFFLPTSDTWELFRLELDLVSEQFRTAVAPVAFLGGWDVVAAIGVAAVVVLSDTFAFRAFARAEALVPGGVLFVFVAALGTDRNRVALSVALVAAGVITTATLRSHHAPRRSATIGLRRWTMGRALPAAVLTAVLVAVVAGAVGPRLPGARAEPLYETKGGNGGTVTEIVSPLVDIRSRLTNQGTSELFVVEADTDSYWRSSALPEFDGRTWGLPERSLDGTDGNLSIATAGSVEIRQTITVAALGGRLLPAAADPINAPSDLGFLRDSSTLVKRDEELTAGDTFEIVSASPRFTAAQLAGATSNDPGDSIYFELPSDFPSSVAETTREVIGDAATPYEAALSVQDWMRSSLFEYSLEIQPGHGNNTIETFLRDKVGYCEQFAGTYAAMMRSVGIPARVAVGFTPGENDGTGRYSVRGRNAHAWPEVWFDGLGWVPFEPTPGRGAPGASDYTGRQQEQAEAPPGGDEASPDGDDQQVVPGADPSQPALTIPGGAAAPTTIPDIAPAFPDQFDSTSGDAGGAGGETTADDGNRIPLGIAVAVVVLLLGALAPTVVRRIRRRSHRDPDVEIRRLWSRAVDAVGAAGVTVTADQTPSEAAAATSIAFPTASRPMNALASSITEAVYGSAGSDLLTGGGTYGATLIGNCSVWCRQIEKAVDDSISPVERTRRYFTQWT